MQQMTDDQRSPSQADREGVPVMRRGTLLLPLIATASVAVLLATDLVLDRAAGTALSHLAVEALAMAAAALGAGLLLRAGRDERQALARAVTAAQAARALAEQDARAWQDEANRWRAEAQDLLRGLSSALDSQFERWGLTPAEAEVALLLLKGLSFKEVAQVRDVSERTARDQARAVYAKGGLGGRAELSAFFLEDLLLPS